MAKDIPADAAVVVEHRGATTRLTMSNARKKNAIGKSMYLDLAVSLNEAAADPDVRVVWLRGANGVFTSGNDIGEFEETVTGENPPTLQFFKALINFPKPIVAQVEGPAIGIGATMLLHCDLVFAAEDAEFQFPFVNLGLLPEAGSTHLLPRLLGQAKAAELLLLARKFTAREAVEMGLVNETLPKGTLEKWTEIVVGKLAKQPPRAIEQTKALLRSSSNGDIMGRVTVELQKFANALCGEEFAEAISALREKRAPDFENLR